MTSLLKMRKGRPPLNALELGRVLGRVKDEIIVAVGAVDSALRSELETRETAFADMRRTQPHVQFPEELYACKDPHRRIRHDHDRLCIEAPHLAGRLGHLAQTLALPTAPDLQVPAFELTSTRRRAPRIIDVQASYKAIVEQVRALDGTPFEDGSASVQSVVARLSEPSCCVGRVLLRLSEIDPTPMRIAIRQLADAVYFASARLRAIANHLRRNGVTHSADPHCAPEVQSIEVRLLDLQKSLEALDTRIREVSLFDRTPRRRHSADIVYQGVVSEFADAGIDGADIARLIVPTLKRDPTLWERRVGEHIRKGDLAG